MSSHTLSNGLPVVVAERPEVPIVAVQLVVRAGAELDLPAQSGRLSMTAEMLDEGTLVRDALGIAEEIDYLGADLSVQPGWDATTVSLEVLSSRLEPALDVVRDIVLNATFPEDEYARKQKECVSNLLLERDEAQFVAAKALAAGVFGDRHPYGAPISGTRASIEQMTRVEVHALYRDRFHPRNSFAIVVGDVRSEEIVRMLDLAFSDWRSDSEANHQIPAVPADTPTQVLLVDKPGAPQAELRVGHTAPNRLTPDYFAMRVLNTVLGGSFTSRLNTILRERMGVTYGARSSFQLNRAGGMFRVSSAIDTEAIARSAQVVIEEMTRLCENRVGAAELERAKKYLALGLPRDFETTTDIAEHLREQLLYRLPSDYWATYVDRILAVTADEVMQVAARHLHPDRAVIAVVADRESVQMPLANAGLGDVQLTEVPT